MLKQAWLVLQKEWRDALRDRRTLLLTVGSSVLLGPLLLLALSALVADLEERGQRRELRVQGIEHAPSLANYLQRQTWTVTPAPADYEAQLNDKRLGDPVLVVPAGFEADLAAGRVPELLLVGHSANARAQAGEGRVLALLQGYIREQVALRLVLRGVAMDVLEPLKLQERDLAEASARAAQFTGMLPFFVLMAVLYGALPASLDTAAGERERGSLEPLLLTPASRSALVLGKWAAVASVGMAVAVISCFSFLPGQWALRSDTLAALFQFGLREAALFLALLLPLAGLASALLMAVAIRCRTVKEAQANATVVMLVASLLPLVQVFNQGGEKAWHLWLPALAQATLMGRVLKGEALPLADLLVPLGVAAALTWACLRYVAARLHLMAVR